MWRIRKKSELQDIIPHRDKTRVEDGHAKGMQAQT